MALTSRFSRVLAATTACAALCLGSQTNAQCVGYTVAAGPGVFVPGTTDIGLYQDDGTTTVALPFNVNFYGTNYSSVTVSSNGNLQFAPVTPSVSYINNCLPSATFPGAVIFPFWDDLYTFGGAAVGEGVFTDLSGAAGSQVFVIEWRAVYCCTGGAPINDFEVKFYENQNYFDVIYSTPMSDRCSATIGCQAGGTATDPFTQYSCNTTGAPGCTGAPTSGLSLRFSCIGAGVAGACCNPAAGTCNVGTAATCTGAGNFLGVGTSCPGTCPQPGACCDTATGACTQTGISGCVSPSTFSGIGTLCTPNPCSGGCCNPATGACTLTSASGCISPNIFQSLGTVCFPNPCPQPPPPANDDCAAAIALIVNAPPTPGYNTFATDSLASHPCTGSNLDVWYRFTTTAAGTFVAHVNSNDNTLMSLVAYDACAGTVLGCVAANQNPTDLLIVAPAAGTYFVRVASYFGTTFNVDVHTAIVGACCDTTTGACTNSISGAAGCFGATTYQGDNTVCTTNPCGQGACCNTASGGCVLSTASGCAAGSTFQAAGTVCTPNPCPQPPTGACCISSTQTCSDISNFACTAQGGAYTGDNTACATSPCAFGACCGGGCSGCIVGPPASCTGTYAGNGTTCAVACPNDGYTVAPSPTSVTFIPAVDDIGLHADDAQQAVTLPFPVNFYGVPYNSVNACTNGFLEFNTVAAIFFNGCLPNAGIAGPAIFPFWDDQRTDIVTGAGIFTTTTGVAPNRTFVIEWRTYYFATTPANFDQNYEVLLYEGQNYFDVVYGTPFADRSSATIGVQANGAAGSPFTEFECNVAGPTSGQAIRFSCGVVVPPSGVCCRGSTCSTTVTTAAACTGSLIAGQTAGAAFPTGTACNAGGSTTTPCCYANYNKANGITVQDIFDFLADWFAGSPYANTGGTGAPGPLAVQNIFDFLTAWFNGGC